MNATIYARQFEQAYGFPGVPLMTFTFGSPVGDTVNVYGSTQERVGMLRRWAHAEGYALLQMPALQSGD